MKVRQQPKQRRRGERGFSLIEVLVAVTIIMIMGTVVVTKLIGNTETAKQAKALTEIKSMKTQADIYQLRTGKPITSLNDLAPDYIEEVPTDPWGGEYTVEQQSDGSVKIRCANYEEKAGKTGVERTDITMGGK